MAVTAPSRSDVVLGDAARAALAHAYAPYSKFRVGAALLTERGNVFVGCNVENASYSVSLCAERTAIVNAVVAEGPDVRIKRLLIVVQTGEIAAPCGACRQFIHEFGGDAEVVLVGEHEELELTMAELLPYPFGPEDLPPSS